MKIYGLQKTTLLDFPGKVACTVFTGGCNFRCPFCHNASLVVNPSAEADYTEHDILSFLERRKNILDGVCVTGGEPLANKDIANFLYKIKSLGFAVKLDTNGSYYDKLVKVINDGVVDYVAMDIKNSLQSYAKTIGVDDFDTTAVEKSVEHLMKCGIDYEFRTTVVSQLHSKTDFMSISEWLRGCKRYFLQMFKDGDNIISSGLTSCTKAQMLEFRDILHENIDTVEIRGLD